MKKKFKDTKVGGILKSLALSAADNVPVLGAFIKPHTDAEASTPKGQPDGIRIIGGLIVLAGLLYFKVINPEVFLELFKSLLGI
jgi:hypothetical protein